MINLVCQKFNIINTTNTSPKQKTVFANQCLAQDSVNFSGKINFETFAKKLEAAKLSPKVFAEKCAQTKPIGAGQMGIVYSVPLEGFEDYVLKLHNDSPQSTYAGPLRRKTLNVGADAKLEQVKDTFPANNFGQAIAKIGNKITILKKVKGISLQDLCSQGVGDYYQKLAQLPQESYNDFAHQVKIVNKKRHIFDAGNAGNIMIEGKKLTIIDLQKDPGENFLGDLILPIIQGHEFLQSCDFLENIKTIMTKLTTAGKKETFYTGMSDESAIEIYRNASSPLKNIFSELMENYYS